MLYIRYYIGTDEDVLRSRPYIIPYSSRSAFYGREKKTSCVMFWRRGGGGVRECRMTRPVSTMYQVYGYFFSSPGFFLFFFFVSGCLKKVVPECHGKVAAQSLSLITSSGPIMTIYIYMYICLPRTLHRPTSTCIRITCTENILLYYY